MDQPKKELACTAKRYGHIQCLTSVIAFCVMLQSPGDIKKDFRPNSLTSVLANVLVFYCQNGMKMLAFELISVNMVLLKRDQKLMLLLEFYILYWKSRQTRPLCTHTLDRLRQSV